jgi:hypothetical protein
LATTTPRCQAVCWCASREVALSMLRDKIGPRERCRGIYAEKASSNIGAPENLACNRRARITTLGKSAALRERNTLALQIVQFFLELSEPLLV